MDKAQGRIERSIISAIQDELSKIADEEIKAAQDRVEQRMRRALGEVTLSVMRNFSLESHGDTLLIRVENRETAR